LYRLCYGEYYLIRKIAQYSIIRPLGKGQFGTVYLGVGNVPSRMHGRESRRRVVALKTIHDLNDAHSSNLLLQEFSLLQQVKHRCIMQVYEYIPKEKTLVMEYVHGVTLRDVLDDLYRIKSRFPSRAAIEIGCEIADALFQAFTSYGENSEPLHLVHRDLKPANIMLNPNGELKILDFGLARVSNSEFNISKTNNIQGTPIYMAPEQAQGMSVDHRTDLFSLGLILYELLMGEPAYPLPIGSANPLQAILRDISAGKFTFTFNELHQKLPSVGPILAKVLQHDPEQRYRDGRDMQFDLRSRLTSSSQQSPLQQFAQYYFQSVRQIENQPTYEELEASLNGLQRAPTLNEVLRNAKQNTSVSTSNHQGGTMSKTPHKPPRRPPPTGKQEEYIIPRAVSGESENDSGMDGDQTSFIALTPQVSTQPNTSPSFVPPPPAPPPPPESFNFQPPLPPPVYKPSISAGVNPNEYPSHPPPPRQPQSGFVGAGHQPQMEWDSASHNPSGVVKDSEVSGSMRVPILLLSAVAIVCIAALGLNYLVPTSETVKSPETEQPLSRSVIEDDEDIEIEEVVIAEDVRPVKVRKKRRRSHSSSKSKEKPKKVEPAAPKTNTGSLRVRIGSGSEKVTNINVTCEGYRSKKGASGGSASFSGVPSSRCKIKFNPSGAIYSGNVAGKSLSCTVSNGTSVRCR
jgi:serine/threonine protein kinase